MTIQELIALMPNADAKALVREWYNDNVVVYTYTRELSHTQLMLSPRTDNYLTDIKRGVVDDFVTKFNEYFRQEKLPFDSKVPGAIYKFQIGVIKI